MTDPSVNGDSETRIKALEDRNRLLERKLRELSTLYNISKALSLSLLTENLLDVTGAVFSDVFNATGFILYLNDSVAGQLHPIALHQTSPDQLEPHPIAYDHPVIGPAFSDSASRMLSGTSVLQDWPDAPFSETDQVFVGPLKNPESDVLGVLAMASAAGSTDSAQMMAVMEDVAENLALAIENAQFIDNARALSATDPLTGLFNRRYMDDQLSRELSRAERHGHVLSVAVVDLDHFKDVNDTHGHDVGDRVLVSLAETMRDCFRQSDLTARYGGDEFVIAMPETSKEQALQAVEKLRQRVRPGTSDELPAGTAPIFSAGISSFPSDADTLEALIKKADRALYRAKGQGGDRVALAEPADD